MNPIFHKFRKGAAFCLALVLVLSALPVSALAAQANTPKEEVVYVNLNSDGSVDEINVVNIFNMAAAGTITDYGDYTQLRNMTSTAPIDYSGNTVTIDAEAGKLYYEGSLDSTVIPWDIAISYFIDGKEYTAEEAAGKSGALKITIDITRNAQTETNFFDAFALQVSLTLDTAKCSNIVAADATIANVGSSKQLTHTILPGNGAQLEITADVVDFSMDGISINAIPLNLDVDVDNEELMGQITELLDAIGKLDDGANSLKDGISSLRNGAESSLADGVTALYSGAKELESGASQLRTGGTSLRSGAKELSKGAAAMDEGIQALDSGITQMQKALNTLNSQSSTLTDGSAAYMDGLKQLQEALNSVSLTNEDLSALTDASAQILDGITQLVEGADTLQQNVSFAALKSIMAEKGLDVDTLKENNTNAQAALRTAIDENKDMADALKKLMGVDITELFNQLEQVILLLGANNAFIDGTGLYLDTVNGNILTLVDGATLLKTNYALFDAEIIKLSTALGSLADSMSTLTNAVNTLVSEYTKIDDGINAYTGAVAEIVSAYTQIVNGSAKLAASSGELKTGASKLYAGTGDLVDGISELYTGAGALKTGTSQLGNGVSELLVGISALYDGSEELENGTSTMRGETEGMDTIVSDTVDTMLSEITGANVEVGSFVSQENENVDSVQFVIKTAPIQSTGAAQAVTDEAEPMTFWQKLLSLFGF